MILYMFAGRQAILARIANLAAVKEAEAMTDAVIRALQAMDVPSLCAVERELLDADTGNVPPWDDITRTATMEARGAW